MKKHEFNVSLIIMILLIVPGCVNNVKSVDDESKTVSAEGEWETVSAGYNHTCAIDDNNDLYCWGNNLWGQFGDGTTDDSSKPKLVNDKKWESIATGDNLTCGITIDSDLYCWGANYYGGTGTGSEEGYLINPGKVGNIKWKTVKVLKFYLQTVCGITTDDELYCWGHNYSVMFGDITEDSYFSRVPQKTGDYKWKKIEIGNRGGCGISTNDELLCWGQGQYQVIDTESENVDLPQKVNDEKWTDISIYNDIYSNNTCAINSDSTLFCWGGMISSSIFGDNKEMVSYGKGWRSVSAGKDDICGIKNDGSLYCFGEHVDGKFYNGGPQLTYDPVKFSSYKWKSLSSGYGFKCGVLSNGHLFCWGLNDYGQIGSGKRGNRNKPEQIGQDSWDDISSGFGYTCGIKNKKLYCWGSNFGQLGDGTKINRQEPVKITDKDWKSVSAYSSTVCAIDENDKLFCWGDTYKDYSSPDTHEQIIITKPEKVNEESWQNISAGNRHVCGIRSDNHTYCWGSNNEGQLGYQYTDPTNQGTAIPHKLDDNEWQLVNGEGFNSTCALKNDGILFCWGSYLLQCQENQSDKSIRQISEIKWKHFDQSNYTLCGITKNNDLYCWGDYGNGNLGIGEVESEEPFIHICEPTKVGNKKWKNISTGRSTTCGIDTAGYLYCWGIDYGIIGIDKDAENAYYADTPQKVGNKKWKEVSVEYNFVCARDENKKLFCWGQNNHGQLGNGMAWVEDMYEVVN